MNLVIFTLLVFTGVFTGVIICLVWERSTKKRLPFRESVADGGLIAILMTLYSVTVIQCTRQVLSSFLLWLFGIMLLVALLRLVQLALPD